MAWQLASILFFIFMIAIAILAILYAKTKADLMREKARADELELSVRRLIAQQKAGELDNDEAAKVLSDLLDRWSATNGMGAG